jgi:hypothetical protein
MRHTIFTCVVLLTATVVAWADTSMRPGKYEVTVEMQLPGAPAPQKSTTLECMTAAEGKDLVKRVMAEMDSEGSCKTSNLKIGSGTVTFDARCDHDGTIGIVRSEMTYGSDWLKGVTTLTMGKDVIVMKASSRWVGAQCQKEEAQDEE